MREIDADAFDKFLLDAEIEATKQRKYVFSSALNTIRGNLAEFPTIEPSPQWIPRSERLPEDNGEYLVTRYAKNVYRYVDIVKKTNTSGDMARDIIAWIPLPEPYEGE